MQRLDIVVENAKNVLKLWRKKAFLSHAMKRVIVDQRRKLAHWTLESWKLVFRMKRMEVIDSHKPKYI